MEAIKDLLYSKGLKGINRFIINNTIDYILITILPLFSKIGSHFKRLMLRTYLSKNGKV